MKTAMNLTLSVCDHSSVALSHIDNSVKYTLTFRIFAKSVGADCGPSLHVGRAAALRQQLTL